MIKIIKKYLAIFLTYSGIFFFLLITPIFSNQKVLFYRGLILFAISSIITFIIFTFFKKISKEFTLESRINGIIFSLSIHLCFFIIFPVTFDRSVTMYLLNTINENNDKTCLQENNIQQKLIDEYIVEQQAIPRRIYEQSIINFIKLNNNCIQLTSKSKKFLKFSNIVKEIYK